MTPTSWPRQDARGTLIEPAHSILKSEIHGVTCLAQGQPDEKEKSQKSNQRSSDSCLDDSFHYIVAAPYGSFLFLCYKVRILVSSQTLLRCVKSHSR